MFASGGAAERGVEACITINVCAPSGTPIGYQTQRLDNDKKHVKFADACADPTHRLVVRDDIINRKVHAKAIHIVANNSMVESWQCPCLAVKKTAVTLH